MVRSAMYAATDHALRAAVASALINNYCDRAEHCETVERDWVLEAAREFRAIAFQIALEQDTDIIAAYAQRMLQIQKRNVLFDRHTTDVRMAPTWRALQLIQVEHDRAYHPDVFGLTKIDQLRHYAFHAAKLAGALARAAQGELSEEEAARRVPDLLLFGVKLSTVMSEKLPDTPLDQLA
jgi:hypothetical protein